MSVVKISSLSRVVSAVSGRSRYACHGIGRFV
jgi:hypothetical protein